MISKSFVAYTIAVSLGLAGTGVSLNSPVDESLTPITWSTVTTNGSFAATAGEWEEALALLDSIPDDVLQAGDEATRQWVEKNSISNRASFLSCTGSIAAFLATNLFAAAKIVKIKKLIKSLGGVKEAVKLMWGASFSYEKMQAAGGALAALAAEFFGIDSVKKNCFQ